MIEFKETNVNSRTWEMNNKRAHEIDQRARQAEKYYQKRMQIEVQVAPLGDTSRGMVFNKVLGSILAVLHRLSGKKLSLGTDRLEEIRAA